MKAANLNNDLRAVRENHYITDIDRKSNQSVTAS